MNATAPALGLDEAAPTFPCPGCRRPHPWAAEHAGRTARCGCGHVLRVPAALDAPAHPAQPVPPPPAPPADSNGIPAFLRAPAAPADDTLPADVEAELAATAKYGEEDFNKPDPRRDVHVPVALLVVGVVLTVIQYAYGTDGPAGAAVAGGVLVAGVKLLIGMLMMLGGALLAAKIGGISFGPLGTALLKLAGLCLAPSDLGDLTTFLLGDDMAVAQIGWAVQIVLYYVLISYLFRLDGWQTVVVVGTVTVVKIVSAVVVGSLLALAFGPAIDGAMTGLGGADDESAISSLEGELEDAGEDADDE